MAARHNWIPASIFHREIVERGYQGGLSQLRAFLRSQRPALPVEPELRFETAMGEQLQVDWVKFRNGSAPSPRSALCRARYCTTTRSCSNSMCPARAAPHPCNQDVDGVQR